MGRKIGKFVRNVGSAEAPSLFQLAEWAGKDDPNVLTFGYEGKEVVLVVWKRRKRHIVTDPKLIEQIRTYDSWR